MSSIVISGDSSGSVTLAVPSVAGTNTVTLPATTGTVVLTDVAGTVALAATGSNIITASTNGTERMRIDSSGNLLVGDSTVTGTRLFVKSAGTSSATNVILGRNSADVNQFSVRSDGAGFINAAAWVYGSDATTKENIEYLEPANCLSLVVNAKPVKFDYIDGQKHNFGYIAQDVQEWLPEAVSETPNGKLGLQDGFINALGTGAIQELAKQIKELNAKVDAQAAEIKVLKGVA